MEKKLSIKNEIIQIEVKQTGAELCAIRRLTDGKDYMWNANPEVWAGYAPVLFPIIGALKNDSFLYKGFQYSLPRHGFIRNNTEIELVESTSSSLTFCLKSNPETLKHFPFHFEFYITYKLNKNSIIVDHCVKNTGGEPMYFSLGGHPAFKCPLNENEKYTDYYLEFEENETAYTYQIESSGLIGGKTDLILNDSNIINLHYNIFDKGALVFKSLKSKKVSLISKISGKQVEVEFEGFPYLGIWAKPNAEYVCIEPWIGIADGVDTNMNFETKEGIVKLEANKIFTASYSINII